MAAVTSIKTEKTDYFKLLVSRHIVSARSRIKESTNEELRNGPDTEWALGKMKRFSEKSPIHIRWTMKTTAIRIHLYLCECVTVDKGMRHIRSAAQSCTPVTQILKDLIISQENGTLKLKLNINICLAAHEKSTVCHCFFLSLSRLYPVSLGFPFE